MFFFHYNEAFANSTQWLTKTKKCLMHVYAPLPDEHRASLFAYILHFVLSCSYNMLLLVHGYMCTDGPDLFIWREQRSKAWPSLNRTSTSCPFLIIGPRGRTGQKATQRLSYGNQLLYLRGISDPEYFLHSFNFDQWTVLIVFKCGCNKGSRTHYYLEIASSNPDKTAARPGDQKSKISRTLKQGWQTPVE